MTLKLLLSCFKQDILKIRRGAAASLTQERALCVSLLTTEGSVYAGTGGGLRSACPTVNTSPALFSEEGFSDWGPSWAWGRAQPPPGNHEAWSSASLFSVHSNVMAVNCRVWYLCHMHVEAMTCDKATRVFLPGAPLWLPCHWDPGWLQTFAVVSCAVPGGCRFLPARTCSGVVCLGWSFPFGMWLCPRAPRTLAAPGGVIEKY